jgi:ribosomal protein L11 methyltransferase
VAIDKLTLLTDAEDAATLEARLDALDSDVPLAVSRFRKGGDWQIEVLFVRPFDAARLPRLLEGLSVKAPPAIAAVADENWVERVERALKPVAAGPFLVHGPHDRAAAAGRRLAIEIEAGGAFGTAHHATTQGCLVALGALDRPEDGDATGGSPFGPAAVSRQRRLLDLGTGSGVLAIAAAKLWPDARIVASDIDAQACRIAAENALLNGVAQHIEVVLADGLGHPRLMEADAFDLVLANILAEPLVALAPDLRRALAPGGRIVLSGLLAEQQGVVLAAYEAQGLRLMNAWPLDGWVTMLVG